MRRLLVHVVAPEPGRLRGQEGRGQPAGDAAARRSGRRTRTARIAEWRGDRLVRARATGRLSGARAFAAVQADGFATGLGRLVPLREEGAPPARRLGGAAARGHSTRAQAGRQDPRRLPAGCQGTRDARRVRVDRRGLRVSEGGVRRSRASFAQAADHALRMRVSRARHRARREQELIPTACRASPGGYLHDSPARKRMQEPWISRQFPFDFPVERIDVFLSRLRGTKVRIANAVRGLPASELTRRREGKWSIHDNVGHLHDLEALHLRRLDELERGAATLSAWDVENRATWNAGHNDRPFEAVFGDFAASRVTLLDRLGRLDRTRLAAQAMHPRLQRPMRAVDVAFFTAEHDDHHVTRIEALVQAAALAPGAPFAANWKDLAPAQPMP